MTTDTRVDWGEAIERSAQAARKAEEALDAHDTVTAESWIRVAIYYKQLAEIL